MSPAPSGTPTAPRGSGSRPSQLNAYSGRGGALHARIDQLASALDDLDDGAEAHATTASRRFARENRPRLEDLALAVRAAEQMPPQRRRVAHRAVSAELDRIELTLLDHLGVGDHLIVGFAADRPPLEGRRPPRFGGRGRCDLSVGAANLKPWTTGPCAGPACCAGW